MASCQKESQESSTLTFDKGGVGHYSSVHIFYHEHSAQIADALRYIISPTPKDMTSPVGLSLDKMEGVPSVSSMKHTISVP